MNKIKSLAPAPMLVLSGKLHHETSWRVEANGQVLDMHSHTFPRYRGLPSRQRPMDSFLRPFTKHP